MQAPGEIPPTPSEADYLAAAKDAPLPDAQEPLALFREWLKEAKSQEPNDANAMALATSDGENFPDVRMVLLKDFGPEGFVFYTNGESRKGVQLAANPRAALLFHWKSLRRQVRLRGEVAPAGSHEADVYFASRARDSRLGAWASDQSREMAQPLDLAKRVAQAALRFGLGEIPRPAHWLGYRLNPISIEFWRDRPFRLHERLEFHRETPGSPWRRRWLFP